MNQLVVAIAEKISAMETAQFFEKRAASSTAQAAQTAWDKVGSKDPIPQMRGLRQGKANNRRSLA